MRTIARRLSVSLMLLFLPAADSMAAVRTPPNYDALALAVGVDVAAQRNELATKLANPGIPIEWESHFGVPSFVWPARAAHPVSWTFATTALATSALVRP